MFLKHGFKDAVLWVSLFLGERAGLPCGSDTLRYLCSIPVICSGPQITVCRTVSASDVSVLQG